MLKFFGVGSTGSKKTDAHNLTLQSLRGYWDAKRVAGALPRRAAIDPRGMADHLEKVFLIERVSKGNARFRLAGMNLHDLMGMDVRGMPISTLFTTEARDRMAGAVEALFDAPSIIEITVEAERGLGRPAVSGRMLLLPLTNRADEVELALGCLVTEGQLGRAPRRFAISSVQGEEVQRAQPPTFGGLKLVAEAASHARVETRLPTAKPRLRLVTTQD